MRSSERGVTLIKRFEGFSHEPYLCPAGYWTIGYGHMLSQHKAMRVDEHEAHLLLMADMKVAERAVERLITALLTQSQFDALVSFTFNLGSGALQRSTLRRKVNHADHAGAALEFHKWVHAAGKRLPGLVSRRSAEANLYMEYQ